MTRLARVSMALFAVVLMAHLSWAAEGVRVTAERVNLRSGPEHGQPDRGQGQQGNDPHGPGPRGRLGSRGRTGHWRRRLHQRTAVRAGDGRHGGAGATTSQPVASRLLRPSRRSRTRVARRSAEPLQFGGNVDWATKSVGFGLGIRASRGIPVRVRDLGALATFDVFFGTTAPSDAGADVDVSGHSFQFGLFPTYSYEFGSVRAYGGAGLSILALVVQLLCRYARAARPARRVGERDEGVARSRGRREVQGAVLRRGPLSVRCREPPHLQRGGHVQQSLVSYGRSRPGR